MNQRQREDKNVVLSLIFNAVVAGFVVPGIVLHLVKGNIIFGMSLLLLFIANALYTAEGYRIVMERTKP